MISESQSADKNGITREPSESNPKFNDVFIPSGVVLCSEGDEAKTIYVVISGTLEVYLPATNFKIATLSKGSSFGEQAILSGGRRGASVRAITDSTCLEISAGAFRETLKQQSEFTRAVISSLLLQLGCMNGVRQALTTADRVDKPIVDINMNKLVSGRSRLDLKALIDTSEHEFSAMEALLLRVAATDGLKTILLHAESDILRERANGHGLIIMSGKLNVEPKHNENLTLGRGAVIGLAEVMAGAPIGLRYDVLSTVNALVIPQERALLSFNSLNKGLKGVFRAVIMRTLQLEKVPQCLGAN